MFNSIILFIKEVYTLTNNANSFKQLLDKNNIYADSWDGEDGAVCFQFNQKLKTGPNGRVMVIFNSEDTLVSIYALDYVTLVNTARKDYMYRLLNDLNSKYTYFKFILDNDNNIILSSFIPLENNFRPEIAMRLILGVLDALEEEYSALMKVMWA